MALDPNIIDWMKREQQRVFRIAQDPLRYGLVLKTIATDSGIGYETLRTYSSGQAVMPMTAFHKLIGVIPAELLSMLLPGGHVIVRAPDEMDHDQIADAFHDYLAEKQRCHHPESEAGREIGPKEDNILKFKAVRAVGGVA